MSYTAPPRKKHPRRSRAPEKCYATTRDENGKEIFLHDLIMQTPPNMHVVFLNGDTLDLRRQNMRLAPNHGPWPDDVVAAMANPPARLQHRSS